MLAGIAEIAHAVREVNSTLTFRALEIGALPLAGQVEPLHRLLDALPGSEIVAFEVDARVCEELNARAKPGLRYFPAALGRTEERRTLYQTAHPMCTSLYRPDEALMGHYHNLEVAALKSTTPVETVSLDRFMAAEGLERADFIKIDVQGAELDVFSGGAQTLRHTLAVVSEVEFVPLYVEQPLFGDVCRYLAERGLMFHKFLGMAGRALKPFVLNNDPNFPSQHMWSDAMFVTDIRRLPGLASEQLLKLGMFASLYGSPDLALHCFRLYDQKHNTGLVRAVAGRS